MQLPLLVSLLALGHRSMAQHLESPYFPGYGFSWYDLKCGYSCYNAISSAMLTCTSMDHSGGGHSHGSMSTSPACRAGNLPFLTTLAFCMNSTCDSVKEPTWRREKFWATRVTGNPAVVPQWDYSEVLLLVELPVTETYNSSAHDTMNGTMLVSQADYDKQSKFNYMFDHIEMLQARYVFVIIIIGFSTPIFFTLLGRLPYMTTVYDKIKPYLVYPSIIGTYHSRPLPWLLGNVPTMGQTLYIVMFFILNLVLSAVNYSSAQPHPWWFPPKEELLAYIGYRTGHIGYALLPLVILFSSRNNILLWVTNWSHSTYMLLHRWVARLFAVHSIIHSITLLITYQGTGSYPVESKQPYWSWGIVATVLVCAMLVFSMLYFRRMAYEAFLVFHIVAAVFVLAGCWYHVILKWGYNFYDNWLYAAMAVWAFDRILRILRVAKNGVRRAVVTEIGEHHVRVEVQGLRWVSRPGYSAYAYFPTLNPLRPWENHPFSINSTALFQSYKHSTAVVPESSSLGQGSSDDGRDVEKSTGKVTEAPAIRAIPDPAGAATTAGVTLFIKKSAGLTKLLKANDRLLTLIDGPYPQTPSAAILKCDRVLLIGGGIGITGLFAWAHAHPNVKLAWCLKEKAAALVGEMDLVLQNIADKEIVVGARLNIDALLKSEAEAGYGKVGVVVCGPGGMADDVRAGVAGLARAGKTVFELEVDSFSW